MEQYSNTGGGIPLGASFVSSLHASLREYFGVSFYGRYLQNTNVHAHGTTLVFIVDTEEIYVTLSTRYFNALQDFVDKAFLRSNIVVSIKKASSMHSIPSDANVGEVAESNVIFSNFNDTSPSFENFIEDESNTFALAQAKAFSGKSMLMQGGLLFLHGDVGYGKTHLARAIAKCLVETGVDSAYFSAESFSNAFVSAIKQKTVFEFKSSILSRRAVVFDDINCLIGRKQTLVEFGNILIQMLDNGQTVIVTSSQQPNVFEYRLKSRLLSGHFALIKEPTIELKRKVALSFIAQKNLSIGCEVADFIAQNLMGGIRELKGAINRLLHSSIASCNGCITLQNTKVILADLLKDGVVTPMQTGFSIDKIINEVCKYFNVPKEEMLSDNRVRLVADARAIAMHLCKVMLCMSVKQISVAFNRGSHQATTKSLKKISSALAMGTDFSIHMESLKRIIIGS